MKAIDIALKDMKQSFQSFFAISFMFGIPILMTGLFYVMFGGGGADEEAAFSLPQTAVQVANLDQGELELGQLLVDVLGQEDLSSLLAVTVAEDSQAARQAVDRQEAGVAVIIPGNFSTVMSEPGGQAQVEIYQDPTMELGPGIVTSIVNRFLDTFSGSKIALDVAGAKLEGAGLLFGTAESQAIVEAYIQQVSSADAAQGLVSLESPGGSSQPSGIAAILSPILGGIMIFYAFFTGTNSTLAILKEEESGTLPRLFTTPTPVRTILTGKFIAIFVTIIVQIAVLLVFGNLVFGIEWGSLAVTVPFALVTAAGATSFGIFMISLVKDTRQAGVVIGAGVTVTGMLGMANVLMLGSPNPSKVVNTLSLFVPQGWANRALLDAFEGAELSRVLLSLGGLLVWSVVFFIAGSVRFNRRFA